MLYTNGMAHRITATLDDEAYKLYVAQPHHRRGAWLSRRIKEQGTSPPLLTATEAQRLYDHYGAYLRWIHTKAE